ncbi:MAG: hypothetical protein ACK5MI_00750 [Mangrovibacterium sp.]
MKRIYSFLLNQIISFAVIVILLFAVDVFLTAKNKYESDAVQEKIARIEDNVQSAVDNLDEWKSRLEEYQDDLESISKLIRDTQNKLKEFKDSWFGSLADWWYDEDIQNLEQTLSTLQNQQQKLESKKDKAIDRIEHYGGQVDYYKNKKDTIASQVLHKSEHKIILYARTALIIIIIGWLSFILVRLFIYYILAPWVGRKKPMCIDPMADGDISFRSVADLKSGRKGSVRIGSTSLEISFSKDEELIAHQRFLQSSYESDEKQTIPFLSKGYWFTSICSGLWAMLRCRTNEDRTVLTLSDPKGIVSGIDIIEVLPNTRFVCQARAVVGVVRLHGEEVKINSVWRFGWHNWLMLRFRYLVFSGPCRLIVKGKHGIVVEQGGRGKITNPDLVLGFSANLNYSNVRSESFWGYLFGWDNIFNDRFQQSDNQHPGYYVCEEVPETRKGDVVSRGLAGLFDTILKIFGI